MRHSWRLGVLCAAAFASACSLVSPSAQQAPERPAERVDTSLTAIGHHLQMMARLAQGSPTEQAEIFSSLKDAAQLTPTTQNRLAYALALATPGHGASDPESGRQQLAALLASPETMLPAERTLALVILRTVEQRLVLQTENKRLQTDAERLEQERRAAGGSKRLQAQIEAQMEENTRLRKQLADAQAKLDEIARIERSITERNPPKKK